MGFHGGYRFKNFEGTAEPVLKNLPVPGKVIIHPGDGIYASLKVLVHEGEAVRAGATLLESEGEWKCAVPVPVSGTVTSVDAHGIIISSDGSDSFEPVSGHTRAPWELAHEDVFLLFCSTGCWMLADRLFNTPGECNSVQYIIVNAVHNGPLDQAWSPEMFGDQTLISGGLRTLKTLFPHAEITIACNKYTRNYFSSDDITVHAAVKVLSDKYPQEHPELLSRDTIRRRLVSPEGKRDQSILVLPYAHVIQLAEVMTQGRPLIDRILMVAGPGVSQPEWYRIRTGTPFDEIRRRLLKSDDRGPWRIVRGNLFSGKGIISPEESVKPSDTEISVIRERAVRELWRFMNPGFTFDSYTRATVAEYIPFLPKQLDSNVHGGERPCVQCNACDEVCPVGIYPFLIWKYVRADKTEESFRFRPYDCIECGLCDYVCPSKIPVSHSVRLAADEYRKMRRPDEVSG